MEDMDVDAFLSGGFMNGDSKPQKTKKSKKEKPKKLAMDLASRQAKSVPELARKPAEKNKRQEKTSADIPEDVPSQQTESASKVKKSKAAASKVKKNKAALPNRSGIEADALQRSGPVQQTLEEPKPKTKKKKSEASQHKAQLDALKESDPEFYNFLQETDKELLDFQAVDEDGVEDDESQNEEFSGSEDDSEDESAVSEELEEDDDKLQEEDGEAETEAQARSKGKASTSGKQEQQLTQDVVEKWCKEAKQDLSIGALERLIKAYRVACHLGDEEEDMDATMRITSSAVFNKILVFVIKEAGGLFRKLLKLPEGDISTSSVKKAQRWKKMEGTVKSFLGNSLHLLSEMTDEGMTAFMLRYLRPSIPFLIVSDRTQRKLLQRTLLIFGSGGTKARVQAYLFLRQMALTLPPPTLTLAMKGVYRQYVLNAKFMSPVNLPHINFMANCMVEMYGLDTAAAYELGFGYLKQIAVILRGALSMKSKDAFKEVYCWQTISSMELWAKVLATHAHQEELKPLVYPVVQLLMGTVRLVPTARYFPLRLRCIHALNKLSQATKQYIPVSALLIETLQWQGLHKQAKAGGSLPSSSVPQLRAGKQLLESLAFQQHFVDEVFLLLAEHLAQWATNVAFPELAHLTSHQLSRLTKKCKNEKLRNAGKQIIAAIQANSDYVIKQRNKLECSPRDTAILDKFMSSPSEQEQAPMRKFAKVLADKWARQQALSRTDEVKIGGANDDSASDREDLPAADLLPELVKKSESRRKGEKPKEKAIPLPQKDADTDEEADDDEEDEIRDFQLSDSEDDSGE